MAKDSEPAREDPRSDAPRAKHLPPRPRLPLGSEAPALVPARMINEVLYCERLAYLEWAQGEFQDNAFTVEGRAVHRRADRGRPLPPRRASESDDAGGPGEPAASPFEARSVWLSSERLGITAKIDVVDVEAGRVVPVEYKRGKAPDLPEGAWLPQRAQVCAQVLLLREHGFECERGEIYFAADRRRVPITIDDGLRHATLDAVHRARTLTAAGRVPPPPRDSAKCDGCSLVAICLPDEVTLLKGLDLGDDALEDPAETQPSDRPSWLEPDDGPSWLDSDDLTRPRAVDPWSSPDPVAAPRVLRRLHPARDERIPLYVQTQGARVTLDGELLAVMASRRLVEARLPGTSQVSLFGNVQVTSQALRELLDRNIPVCFFSYGGWFRGRTRSHGSKNIELRIAQHRAADDPALCLRVARGMVQAKILNCRTLLRRNAPGLPEEVLVQLRHLARKALEAESLESLLGIEGTAAREYFGAFTGMLKGGAASGAFDIDGRNRRPPRDPINALLSFAYSLLCKDLVVVLDAVGLEPLLGFFHQPRYGRPALALDLMEELRPLLADSVVLGALNNAVVQERDFVEAAGSVGLGPAARKRFISAYERRMDQLVTHPVFGYRISYRRVLEVQARLLGRMLLGEIDEYPSFRTR